MGWHHSDIPWMMGVVGFYSHWYGCYSFRWTGATEETKVPRMGTGNDGQQCQYRYHNTVDGGAMMEPECYWV